VPPTSTSVHRVAPAVVARLLGLVLVGLAGLLLAGTLAVALAGLSVEPVVALALLGAVACSAFAWWLCARAWVLHCTDLGYRVRLVRGAGVQQATWGEVEKVVTTYRHDVACLELQLRDGRTTTIPVGLLRGNRDDLVREVQSRLRHGPRLGAG
jgi:hypothetical protein